MNQWENSGNLQIHIQKSVTQQKNGIFHRFHQISFLLHWVACLGKSFSQRERERARERVSERECLYARKFNGNGKWLNSKT